MNYLTKEELVLQNPDITIGFIDYWFPVYPVPKIIADELLNKTRNDGSHIIFRHAEIAPLAIIY